MEVAFYGGIESFEAPAAGYDDAAYGQQGIGMVHFVGELEGHDEASPAQFGQNLGAPQTIGIGEVVDGCAGDGFELFGGFIDLNLPVFPLVFFDVMMVPGMAADDVSGGIEFFDLVCGHIVGAAIEAYGHDEEDAAESIFFHFGPGDGILVFVGVIEGQHDRFAGQGCAPGEIGVELVREDGMIAAVVEHFELGFDVGGRHDIVF